MDPEFGNRSELIMPVWHSGQSAFDAPENCECPAGTTALARVTQRGSLGDAHEPDKQQHTFFVEQHEFRRELLNHGQRRELSVDRPRQVGRI
jgi:hypothetical protein